VGKASLINAITGQNHLARASNTPGRTQELNYFTLCGHLNMVDLPGYGFAKAPKEKVDVWNALIRDYLQGRVQLQRIFILIDSRHGLKKIDEDIFTMLDKVGVTYQIVLTKTDKISDVALNKLLIETTEKLKKFIAVHPKVLATSSEKKRGLDDLRHEIALFIPAYAALGVPHE
jgi:GTP-binding protein